MYAFATKVIENRQNPELDFISWLNLSKAFDGLERVENNEKADTKGLLDIVYSPDVARLIIRPLEKDLLTSSVQLKAGPIPGISSLASQESKSLSFSPVDRKRKKESPSQSSTNSIVIKRIRQEDSQHRTIEH